MDKIPTTTTINALGIIFVNFKFLNFSNSKTNKITNDNTLIIMAPGLNLETANRISENVLWPSLCKKDQADSNLRPFHYGERWCNLKMYGRFSPASSVVR